MWLDTQFYNPAAIPGRGNIPSKWAMVFGAPSLSRTDENSVVGPATLAVLKRMLPSKVLDDLYITALLKEPTNIKKRLPKRPVREAYPKLIAELRAVGAERVMVIGSELADLLCPGFVEMPADHGALFQNPVLSEGRKVPVLVVPTFHFATTTYRPQNRDIITRDINRWTSLPVPNPPVYKVVKSSREIPWQDNTAVVLDIETTGFDSMHDELTLLGFKFYGSSSPVYIFEKPSPQELIRLMEIIDSRSKRIIGHNLQFDLEWLMRLTNHSWTIPIEDTMLMAHNAGEDSLGLKHLTTMYTDRPGSHAFGGFEDLGYLAEDVLSTEAIYNHFGETTKTYVHRLFSRATPLAAEIRWKGVPIEHHLLKQYSHEQVKVVKKIQQELVAMTPKGFGEVNWNSPEQVVKVFQKLGVKLTERTDAGAYTVKEAVLLTLKDKYPVVAKLLEYREQIKFQEFLDSYTALIAERLAKNPKWHPVINPRLKLHGAKTGRTSMEDPNLQQVTRTGPLKLMFISEHPGGYIGLVDLSQAELRVACLLSGDRKFLAALLSDDVHTTIASMVFNIPRDQVPPALRKKSKGVTFGLLYGGGAKGLAGRMGVPVIEVEKVISGFYGSFPELANYIKYTKRMGLKTLKSVDHFGRIRDYRYLREIEGDRSVERKAINTPIQGLASHMSLEIMTYCYYRFKEKRMKSRVLFGVHDSTILSIHPSEVKQVQAIVQEAFLSLNNTPLKTLGLWGQLPIVGELIIGASWAAVESTNENYAPVSVTPVSTHPKLDLTGGRKKHGTPKAA